jgi:hypothetical protein
LKVLYKFERFYIPLVFGACAAVRTAVGRSAVADPWQAYAPAWRVNDDADTAFRRFCHQLPFAAATVRTAIHSL